MNLMFLAVATLLSAGVMSQAIPTPTSFTIQCSAFTGGMLSAPDWRFESDGMANQSVVVTFNGERELGNVSWRRGSDAPYYESPGIGSLMNAGFAVTILADEYIETYVYNAGTTELLYSSIRSGSRLLPNNIKAFKARCVPAGNLAK
jgi:hypothetical protein